MIKFIPESEFREKNKSPCGTRLGMLGLSCHSDASSYKYIAAINFKRPMTRKNKTPNLSLRPECLLQNIIYKPKGLAQPWRAVKNHNSTTEVILIKLKDRKRLKKKLTFLRGSHVTEVVQLRRGWTQTVTA